MRHRRTIGAALGAAVLVATLLPMVHNALAAAPSEASLPDFTASPPIIETRPSNWDLEVVTGGVHAGDKITFTFLYGGKLGDRAHAVNFSAVGGDSQGNVKIETLGSVVPGVPVPPPPTQMCAGNSDANSTPHSTDANPYAQSITLTLQGDQPANTVLVYCFEFGEVGFPEAAGSDYTIRYTEGGNGSTDTPKYTVQGQQAAGGTASIGGAAVADTVMTLSTADGTDVTNTGLGGSSALTDGTTYNLTLFGTAGNIYDVEPTVYDASTELGDPAAKVVITGTGPQVGACIPGPNKLCGDQTSFAHGTVVVTNPSAAVDYVLLANSDRSDTVPSSISLTAGPPHSSPPTPIASETPIPGVSPTPALPFDRQCAQVRASHGLGAPDVLDAFQRVLVPDADAICAELSNTLSFIGSNDDHAVPIALGDFNSPFVFAGLDRSLSAAEYGTYTGTNPSNEGVEQFPVLIEPIVVSYNLDGCSDGSRINLRSAVLSGIFTGAITKWNDPTITIDNSSLKGCNLPILVAHDTSYTSVILKDYMSKDVPAWNAYKQPQLANAWPGTAPVSCTANGSKAMALCVSGQPGTIGYGYYRDMVGAALPYAALEAGTASAGTPVDFMASPLDAATGCTNAAANSPSIPASTSADWSSTSLTDMPLSYPLCAFDYVVTPSRCHFNTTFSGLRAFLGAIYTDKTQTDLTAAGFAPLPPHVIDIGHAGYGDPTTDPTVVTNPSQLQQC
jgi:ABC-type phosphate transport system substrate-binding protein